MSNARTSLDDLRLQGNKGNLKRAMDREKAEQENSVPLSEGGYIWDAFAGNLGSDRYHSYGPYNEDDKVMLASLQPSRSQVLTVGLPAMWTTKIGSGSGGRV